MNSHVSNSVPPLAPLPARRVAVLGHDGGTNVGGSLLRAAQRLGQNATLWPIAPAFGTNRVLRTIAWRCFDHRPLLLNRFSDSLVEQLCAAQINVLITSGIAPINVRAIKSLRERGIRVINFSTDDPWNRWMSGRWFRDCLAHYDHVFSPRTSNLTDIRRLGATVSYLPFGYDDELFYQEAVSQPNLDVAFVGAADADRMTQLRPLLQSGLRVALYGGLWKQYREAKPYWRGLLDVTRLRQLAHATHLSLICVRRLNRDEHVMRSFEAAATGACMLVEDTSEHRTFFGEDGACVRYFSTGVEIPKLAQELLRAPARCDTMRANVLQRISAGGHRYLDRLHTMLSHPGLN